ncbi:MAG: nitroreductase family deazaflavin-dependent oxidoreductase [Chloroflexi bacterium]|nr:nitroreductase family deazaflavin-dependent oxidoreductase [Chloroflexota bacterium]
MYRIGLGGLMPARPMLGGLMPGHLMLTTVGRRSGRPRRVVVDMWRDTATDTYYVASGFGQYADWHRNLRANQEVGVQVGWRRLRARATTLPEEQAEEWMLGRWRQHGRLMRFYGDLSLRMIGLKGWSTEEEVRAAVAEMRIVALRPAVDGGEREGQPREVSRGS